MRSANRGNGYNAWNVNPSGNVNNNNAANNSLTLAPDCTGQRRHGWIIDQAATVNSTGSRIPGPEGQNNTNPIPPSCGRGGYTRCGLIKMNQEEIIGFEALYQSMQQCKKGVMWKGSVAHYVLNGLEETYKLSQQLKDGTYKPRKPSKFTVYSPKQRDIVSISFKDRVYQRSLNDNGIYDGMTRSFIEDNQACHGWRSSCVELSGNMARTFISSSAMYMAITSICGTISRSNCSGNDSIRMSPCAL